MFDDESIGSVCVVGLGYIGLPTASLLATKGFRVHGFDLNPKIVNTINRGDVHIVEPDLDVLVKSAVQSGLLRAGTEPQGCETFVIAVPTPLDRYKNPDISYVESATRSIAPFVAPGNLVILESTSPVGTTEKVAHWLAEERPDLHLPSTNSAPGEQSREHLTDLVCVAHCPERVLPGQILRELVDNDRIIGGLDHQSAEKACQFYSTFVSGEILLTDSRTAELSKLTENAFRDVNIAFANELAAICERVDIDVWQLIELANRHPRVNILRPGPGVGGHCIPIDPWFIVAAAGNAAPLLRAARTVNEQQPKRVAAKVRSAVSGLESPTVALLGLAYKENIDDLRESPAIEIARELLGLPGGRLVVVEPHIRELPKDLQGHGTELVTLEAAIQRADVLVVLLNHNAFGPLQTMDLTGKVVVDLCGLLQASSGGVEAPRWHEPR